VAIVDATVVGHICPIVGIDGVDRHFGDTVQLDDQVTDIPALIEGGHVTVP
jgi:hypothetical protein